MDRAREKVVETLKGFGFDDFMAGQIFEALKKQDLINTEPRGDSIGTVLLILEESGMDLKEVHAVVEEMLNSGVVFRER